MRLLFVKSSLAWPRSSGHDVHTFYTMKACAELGHDVGLMTAGPPDERAVAGVPLAFSGSLDQSGTRAEPLRLTRLQERFRSFWGVEPHRIAAVREAERTFQPDAIVVVGLDALPFLGGIERAVRVWYAADEWIWHHLSLVQPLHPDTYTHVRVAALKGLYERAYAPAIDRAWVVSETERRAMRWLAGVRHVDLVPNGVDGEYYAPASTRVAEPETAVFWGRLDFEPNIQALSWFCGRVWPIVRRDHPQARFTIVGFKASAEVRALATGPGIELKADLPDLRCEVRRHAVAVMPFVSGGGIKNKLLEAAAMGLPLICTPRALGGLKSPPPDAMIRAERPEEWAAALTALWASEAKRDEMAAVARRWVLSTHTWQAGAASAMSALSDAIERRRAS